MAELVVGLTLLLGAAGPAMAQSPAVETSGPGCRTISHENNTYAVCEIDLRRQTLKLYWKQANGAPYGSLINLAARTRVREGRVLFATNAGMYHRDRTPVGLYVENGRELAAVNSDAGAGNFFLKPNGVFFVAGNEAGLMETGRFVQQRLKPTLATQSGPMLVIDGALHPRISQQGASKNVRNGVGVIRPAHGGVRHFADAGEFRRVRAAVSRSAQLRQRALSRRQDLRSLCPAVRAQEYRHADGPDLRRFRPQVGASRARHPADQGRMPRGPCRSPSI